MSNSMLRLGIENCPACAGRGKTLVGVTCFFCLGAKKVPHALADSWREAHDKAPGTEKETGS